MEINVVHAGTKKPNTVLEQMVYWYTTSVCLLIEKLLFSFELAKLLKEVAA